MPELPEVETVVNGLRRRIIGGQFGRVRHASSRIDAANRPRWKSMLKGRTVEHVTRRGKYIIIHLSDGHAMVIHLRMTGRLWVKPKPYRRGGHDRFIVDLMPDHVMLLSDARQFGRVEWIPPGGLTAHEGLNRLGPDALDVSVADFKWICHRAQRPVKSLLLDQTRIAGIGNIYADESLFAAGIKPLAVASRIGSARLQRLHTAILDILHRAIAACGTTFDTFSDLTGEAGGFAPQLRVYQRDGSPCPNCGTIIRRIVVSGRGTHYCPRCQR